MLAVTELMVTDWVPGGPSCAAMISPGEVHILAMDVKVRIIYLMGAKGISRLNWIKEHLHYLLIH